MTAAVLLFDSLPRPSREVTPGVAFLPGALPLVQQEELVTQFREIARAYAGTPHAMVRPQLKSGQMSVYMLHLGQRWDYQRRAYLTEGVPPLPRDLVQLAHSLLADAIRTSPSLAPWADMRMDMALINYYPPGASMGLHVDGFEESAAPVISLSIGEEALFRIGNTENRNAPWDEVTLCSGDVIVFGGPKRRAYHGVPRLNPGTAPEGCGIAEGRINVTFRQVDAA